jgi:EAL domain-containing protein (putative c-di-GMP-specific phosphodiesterase class I)
VPLGLDVLEQACRQLAVWSAAGHRLTMAVNLSARQLADAALVDQVDALLVQHGLHGSQLLFEITETTLVEDVEGAADVLAGLRALGARLAIDDFGTGYSSLLYLKRFRVDALKIDRSFVDGLGTDPGDTAIVAAVVRLAHTLDLTVIAEGVETAEQLRHLQRLDCDSAQGYLWSRPVPPEELDDLLAAGITDIVRREHHEEGRLDDLLAVLTHELSTPLTVIGGYAEMLGRQVDDDDERGATDLRSGLSAIERNVDSLTRLVDALVEARGLGAAGESVTVDLRDLVTDLLADLAPLVAGHPVAIETCLLAPMVHIDPVGMRQIVTNLLANATKFAPAGTRLDVVVAMDGSAATLSVADHGAGVPAEREHELFGRFARLGSTRKGLGLGLHLSRLIARRLGGDLRHRPTPGGGATFVLELPVVA